MGQPMQIHLGPIAPTLSPSAGSAAVGANAAGGDSPFARLLSAQQGAADAAKPEEIAADDSDCAPLDPALSDWLAAMQLPMAPAPEPAQTGATAANSAGIGVDTQAQMSAAASANAMPAALAGANTTPNTKPDTSAGTLRSAEPGPVGAGPPDAAPLPQHSEPSARAAVEQLLVASAREHEVAAARIEPSLAVDSAPVVAVMAATPRADGIASPVAVSLATPAMAPEFRAQLGVQVSMLARDGVQHAELRLNPAEMGPISVQIALNGTQAQIDFGADSATTRQIIESGLPELAAALRDAGLTLAGGGVSQHSRGRSQGDGAEPGGQGDAHGLVGGAGEEKSQPAVGRVGWRVPQGAVDLYA